MENDYSDLINIITGGFIAITGALVPSIVNWRIKSKGFNLKILEKIFDKRLQAHDEVLSLTMFLREVCDKKI